VPPREAHAREAGHHVAQAANLARGAGRCRGMGATRPAGRAKARPRAPRALLQPRGRPWRAPLPARRRGAPPGAAPTLAMGASSAVKCTTLSGAASRGGTVAGPPPMSTGMGALRGGASQKGLPRAGHATPASRRR
jgi:hypothetical protein